VRQGRGWGARAAFIAAVAWERRGRALDVVTTIGASTGERARAGMGLGTMHIGQRDEKTSPWRSLGGWGARVAAIQEEGDHVHGRLMQECRGALGTRKMY
jgi:hypothetical protein